MKHPMTGGRPRPTTATRQKALQTALIDAAERTIAADGLPLRARPLAEAAACSVGAIYTLFPDLDAIILAVNARTLAAIDHAMTQAATATDPTSHLVQLAAAYLDYAARHRPRWSALFQHTHTAAQTTPDWYASAQQAAFSHIELPLAHLRPDLPPPARALLARTLFAAVHGMVTLGLDEKLAALPLPLLQDQISTVVTAITRGISHHPDPLRHGRA